MKKFILAMTCAAMALAFAPAHATPTKKKQAKHGQVNKHGKAKEHKHGHSAKP